MEVYTEGELMTTEPKTALEQAQRGVVVRERTAAELAVKNVDKLIQSGADLAALERFIELQDRVIRMQAKAEADAAFADMQDQLPTIDRKGEVYDKHGNFRYDYARFEDILESLRPLLKAFRFAPRFTVTYLDGEWHGWMEITCILAHANGHERSSSFRVQPDRESYMSPTQQEGAARSYGKRYALLDVLGLATRGEDTDAQRHAAAAYGDSGAATKQERQQATSQRSGYSSAGDTRLITDAQLRRLVVISQKSKRPEAEVKPWAAQRYGIRSRKELTREQYDDYCRAIESPGPLPAGVFRGQGQEREPGEEG